MQALALPRETIFCNQFLEWLQIADSLSILVGETLILIGHNLRVHLTCTELTVVHWPGLKPIRLQGKLDIHDFGNILIEFRGPSVAYRLHSRLRHDGIQGFVLSQELNLNGNPSFQSHEANAVQMALITAKLKIAKSRQTFIT